MRLSGSLAVFAIPAQSPLTQIFCQVCWFLNSSLWRFFWVTDQELLFMQRTTEHSRLRQGFSFLLHRLFCRPVATPEWTSAFVVNIRGGNLGQICLLAALTVISTLTVMFYHFSARVVSLSHETGQCCNFSSIILWKLSSIAIWFSKHVLKNQIEKEK